MKSVDPYELELRIIKAKFDWAAAEKEEVNDLFLPHFQDVLAYDMLKLTQVNSES